MQVPNSDLNREFPILEFDPAPRALFNPGVRHRHPDVPIRAVGCFFQEVIDQLNIQGRLTLLTEQRSEMGAHPLYLLIHREQPVAVYHPLVGASVSAALLEEIIVQGCQKFIVCGGAGVLNREIAVGHLVVPISAVRDEGTSYHYLPPAREVQAHPAGVAAIEQTLRQNEIEYILGKTWTTDGLYRETPAKVALRRAEGCVTVEMETAAFFAVAQFRGVVLGQILYGGDDVSGDGDWDHRGWNQQMSTREKLFWLAVESVLQL